MVARVIATIEAHAARRGPLSRTAARELAEGKPIAGVTARFLAQARLLATRGAVAGLQPRDAPVRQGPPVAEGD